MKNFSIKTKNIKIMIENDNSFHAGNYDITSGRNVKKFKKVDEYFMILSPFVHDCIFDQDQSSDYIWKIPSNIPSTVIRIKGNEIWIHSSLYRHQDLFFIFIQSEIFITTDLSEALKNKENSINVRYCQNFILSSEKFNEETAFSGIFRIPMGTIFHWDGQNYTLSSSLTVNKKYTKSLSEFSHYYKQAISSNLKLIVHHYGMPN